MEKPAISFFAMIFILLFAVIGFIIMVFDLNGLMFAFELGILLVFMFFLTFAMLVVRQNKSYGWQIIAGILILSLLDAFVILLFSNRLSLAFITTIFFSAIGLVAAFVNIAISGGEHKGEISGDKSKYYYPYIDKLEPKAETKSEAMVEKTFTPGKFIASKNANKFHSPKCDWALRIGKSNQMWFASKEEAQSKGFEADKCVG